MLSSVTFNCQITKIVMLAFAIIAMFFYKLVFILTYLCSINRIKSNKVSYLQGEKETSCTVIVLVETE